MQKNVVTAVIFYAKKEKPLSRTDRLTAMPKIESLDEAVIESQPMVVYKAVLNEYGGVTHWWMPIHESKLRGDSPIAEGAVVDIAIHRTGNVKFSYKITKLVEGKLINMDISGDFVGTGSCTFEPEGDKTKMQFRWNVKIAKLGFVILSPFVSIAKGHSEVMQAGFKALNSFLSENDKVKA